MLNIAIVKEAGFYDAGETHMPPYRDREEATVGK